MSVSFQIRGCFQKDEFPKLGVSAPVVSAEGLDVLLQADVL